SGSAVKPGDVIKSLAGKTIEIINTDAEGRLILCDALSYARRFKPVAVLDAATLTGAVVVALGHAAIGIMGTDEALLGEVREAGERAGERCWPLPLWDEYRDLLKSDVADVKNSAGRGAGTIAVARHDGATRHDARHAAALPPRPPGSDPTGAAAARRALHVHRGFVRFLGHEDAERPARPHPRRVRGTRRGLRPGRRRAVRRPR